MIDHAALADIERLALLKLAPEVDRGKVKPGRHDVDFTVRFTGVVNVSEDHDSIIAAAVPWERVALLALSKLNEASREKLVRDAMGEALEGETNEIKTEALAIADKLKGKTRKEKLGGVRLEIVTEAA